MNKKQEAILTAEITITKDKNTLYPGSYHDVAKMLQELPHPINSVEWLEAAQAKIKRFGHCEKLSVYGNLKHWLDSANFLKEIILGKYETHKDFAARPDDMQIYGRGGWKRE